jgi:hypothetical protein
MKGGGGGVHSNKNNAKINIYTYISFIVNHENISDVRGLFLEILHFLYTGSQGIIFYLVH